MTTLVKAVRMRVGRRAVMCAMVCAVLLTGSLASEAYAQDAVGTWQGTLQTGRPLRLVITISKTDDGGLEAVMYSIDQRSPAIAGTITQQGTTITIAIPAIGAGYEGRLSADAKAINGTFTQGGMPFPLNLARATPETAWAIPAPPTAIPRMAPDAQPTFEVATIKPSEPNRPGTLFTMRGRQVLTINTSLNDLITFAYEVHPTQIVDAPEWLATEKFDITGQPDVAGQPNLAQMRTLVRTLLTDRFGLTFHREKRELSVYALVVGPTGPTLTKSAGDPNGLPSLLFRQPGVLPAQNATMADFAGVMQAAVLDRPVVDQTGITGRYDFLLRWTPDASQFVSLGLRVPPPSTTDPSAPPGLFTAIREQLGLEFDATEAPADVLVVDRVERPSAN